MPFTISHAAAIIPFNKKPFILSALMIGSFSPDFSYFLPYNFNGFYTHTILELRENSLRFELSNKRKIRSAE
ncbi:MAG: DUF4184 family protein [Leptospirales bacterium]